MGKWTTIAEAAIELLSKKGGGALPDTTLPIRPARENLRTVVDSNTIGGRVSGDEMLPIDSLSGGPSLSARGQKAVDDIVEQMSGPDGFIERLIVDQDNNVIEGAHRVEALRRLGIEQVPITRVVDPTASLDLPKMGEAINAVGPIHSDHVNQITAQVGDMLAEVGGDPAKVLQEFDLPKGFERFFRAALDSVPPKALPTDEASRMARAQEMGFGPVMYHGSKQDIDEFVPGYDDGLTFLADDPQFANDWIGKGRLKKRIGSEEELKSIEQRYDALRRETIDWEGLNKMPPGDEFSAAYDKAVSEFDSLNELHPRKAYGAVYPVRTNVQNVFDPRKDYAKVEDFLRSEKRGDVVDGGLHKSGNWLVYENKAMVDELKRQGYDAIRIAEKMGDGADGVHGTLAVFDPKNIRSTSAKFDPAKAGSADILAGLAGLGLLGAGASAGVAPGTD